MPGTFIFKPIEVEFEKNPNFEKEKHELYCRVKMGSKQATTNPCCDETSNPRWNDSLTMEFNEEKSVIVELKDKCEEASSKRLGQLELNLGHLKSQGETEGWFDLTGKGEIGGRPHLEVCFKPDITKPEGFDYKGKGQSVGVVTDKLGK